MFEDLFSEEYWRERTLRGNMKGVRLEEANERLESTYREAIDEVETFTGREFVEVPELRIVAEESPRELFEDGFYFANSNSVVVDPSNVEREPVPDSGWEPLDLMTEKIAEIDIKDIMLEELAHGLQDQQNGVTNYEHGPKKNLKSRLGIKTVSKQADFVTEGFADYVTSYLGGNSLEFTAAGVKVSKMLKEQEDQQGWLRSKLSNRPDIGGISLDHTVERYLGHLFYNALEQEGGHKSVMDSALDSPPDYGDLGEVFQKIENSEVEKDEEVYKFAKRLTKEKYSG